MSIGFNNDNVIYDTYMIVFLINR